MTNAPRIASVVGVSLLVVLASASHATAERGSGEATSASGPLATQDPVRLYSSQFGVAPEEAARRLEQQGDLANDLTKVAIVVGDRLAGTGFQHDKQAMRTWILVTGDTPLGASALAKARDSGIEVRYGAKRSLSQLRDDADRIPFIDGVRFVEVDEANNAIRVGTSKLSTASSSAVLSRSTASPIIVERTTGTAANATTLYGGETMTNAAGNCTSGFAVKNSAGTRGMLTAGHCPNALSQQGKALKTATESFDADLDAQWHQLNTGDTVVDDFRCNTGGPHPNYCDVTSIATPATNQFVCHYGYRSGISCGTTTSVWSDPGNLCGSNWASNCDANFIRITGTYLKGCAGDSGGPTYQTGGVAYGIFKAVTDINNCTGANKIAWSTRLDEVASHLSVTVLTS